jgi:hypothetical protein
MRPAGTAAAASATSRATRKRVRRFRAKGVLSRPPYLVVLDGRRRIELQLACAGVGFIWSGACV